jgi:penicillin-binding protein 1C
VKKLRELLAHEAVGEDESRARLRWGGVDRWGIDRQHIARVAGLAVRVGAVASVVIVTAVVFVVALMLLIPAKVEDFAAVRAKWVPSEAYLLDRNGVAIEQQRMDFKSRRFEWMPLDSVSPALIAAIVDGEDRRFWEHGGVDWAAMLGAIRDQSVSRRRRGASTLTMQLAKMLQLSVRAGVSPGAFRHKLAQVRVARTLESRWTKQEILEAYLNLVSFRGELQGIHAASRMLAGKTPSGLSLAESVVLAALLPSPVAEPNVIVARACARAAARRVSVSCDEIRARAPQMLEGFDRAGGELAAGAHMAPHLARTMLGKAGERVRTTLDANVQRMANEVLRQQLAMLTSRNVRDGAVLVVENSTGHVLAYVGSAGETSRAREVDGVRARRQAGSTLKPFLYELAIERGYLNAASLLDDSPIALDTASGIYLPQNYDRDFKGLVSVRTALGSSLNVPAVRALVLTGVEAFRDRLYSLGYAGITQPGDFYGYALALGSAEVSLWEQVQAYRVLARGGEWSPITTRLDATGRADLALATQVRLERGASADEVPSGRPATSNTPASARGVLSADASFVVADVLADRAARTVTFGLGNYLNTPFWSAVKTGTSKDMRDNWCIGFSRSYTVGVWVGNFEGDSMHDVSGVTGAAPIWNQVMRALHANEPSVAPEKPAGVVTALARFTPAVESARNELFLKSSHAKEQRSSLEQRASSEQPASPEQRDQSPAIDHLAVASITAVAPGGEIARIANPANGMVIAIDPDIPTAFQRVPLTASGVTEGMVLKLNGTVLGKANARVLWSPIPGAHLLALEDSAGHTLDRAHFIVR